jgi:type I restriction enzyme R subunit
MLEQALLRYQNRTIEAAQVINELIQIAMDLRAGDVHAKELGLTEVEVAFYDALAANESAVQVLGDETLAIIAREVLRIVRENATIDWTVRENVRANLRRLVKRVLRKYGYPPDKQEIATQTVIEQAELLARDWAE